MRPLSTSEKRLLGLCLLTIFVVFNVFLLKSILGRITEKRTAITSLEADLESNQTWLSDREFWESRREWIDANLPTLSSAGQAQGELIQQLQDKALEQKFEVVKQTLHPAESTADYQTVSVSLNLKGDLEKLTRWLTTLQSPNTFHQVRRLELELNDDDEEADTPQAECNITIARWFKPEAA